MKSNQIVKFIHYLQVFISIQLLIRLHGEHLLGAAFISLLIKVMRKGQNQKCETILRKKFYKQFLTSDYTDDWYLKKCCFNFSIARWTTTRCRGGWSCCWPNEGCLQRSVFSNLARSQFHQHILSERLLSKIDFSSTLL